MRGRSQLTYTIGLLALGAALAFTGPVAAWAQVQPIDPATQPHLKSWSNVILGAKRFIVLADFQNAAVLDRETGLVWEQSPTANSNIWELANRDCINRNVGGRKGWRLPSIPELASLIDPSVAPPGPTLPAGHPFTNVLSPFGFWSATQVHLIPQAAWVADFVNGGVDIGSKPEALPRVWCVRGGASAEAY